MLKISYHYRDEFDQESTLTKTFTDDTLDVTGAMELLVEEFERFIVGAGFGEDGFLKFMKERYENVILKINNK